MRPSLKYAVIHRYHEKYPISIMCRFFSVSRSGYYDFIHRLDRPAKDYSIAKMIRHLQEKHHNTYGYRRICIALASQGVHYNPKTILRIMKKYELLSEIRRKRKWTKLHGQIHRYENLLNQNFYTEQPNSKWVTDISYIHTKQGTLYLSMIRDLYDNRIVAYKTAISQTVSLVLDTIFGLL